MTIHYFRLKGKNRSYLGAQNKEKPFSGNSKYLKLEKGDKSDKQQSKHSRVPFYRRTVTSDDLHLDVDVVMTRNPVQTLASFKGPVQACNSSSLPALRTTNYENAADESPRSTAPSPLAVLQPSVPQSASDPTMPTLSPHPPPKVSGDKDLSHVESHAHAPVTVPNGDQFSKPTLPPKPVAEYQSTYQSSSLLETKCERSWLDVSLKPSELPPVKRPGLPVSSFDDEDEYTCNSLYDFSAHKAWYVVGCLDPNLSVFRPSDLRVITILPSL